MAESGIVIYTHHPMVQAEGLKGVRLEEIVAFSSGGFGQVFSVDESKVDILNLSKSPVHVGSKIYSVGKSLTIPVGEELFGHIINPLGEAILEKGHLKTPKDLIMLEEGIPGIDKRERIGKPFLTGVSLVDLMIPLGKGQKELIIGDRDTGKTSFLLTTLKTQVQEGSIVIYAAIGKGKSEIKKITEFLTKEGILEKVIIIASLPDDSPGLINLTPGVAVRIAEYFQEKGNDVVVVLDDLSTHAKYYREISLISGKFPGRDSYPGDLFYVHARILERAGSFKNKEGGTNSITILPVAEVVDGDFAGFIPTNLMGMTDGHIYFDSNEFNKGKRPAINIPLSVTRVGRQAQTLLMRDINQLLISFLAQFNRIEELSHLGAELSEESKRVLRIGHSFTKMFNQQFGLSVPIGVQLILAGLLWNELLDTSADSLEKSRDKLIKAYSNPAVKDFIEKLLASITLEEFSDKVFQNREELTGYIK